MRVRTPTTRFREILAAALAALFVCVGPPSVARATLFVVDSTADDHDAAAGDGVCATAIGDCTLRAAVEETNALPGHDSISLPAGTYALTGTSSSPYAGTLVITGSVDLLGAGAASTVIDGGGLYRVMQTWLDTSNAVLPRSKVRLNDLTIANGNGVVGPNAGIYGAGILNQGDLTLERCIVRNNSGHIGAAILNLDTIDPVRHPRLTIRQTEIRHNVSQTSGAGVATGAGSKVVIESCLFSNNHADAPGALGGALLTGFKSRVTVKGSQFTDNSSNQGGGAISNGGSTTISDSAISNNSTAGSGGGIIRFAGELNEAYLNPGRLKLVNVTITGNRADSDDTGGDHGGGIMSGTRGLVRVNTTISGNFTTGGAPDDCTCFF